MNALRLFPTKFNAKYMTLRKLDLVFYNTNAIDSGYKYAFEHAQTHFTWNKMYTLF